MKVTTKMGAAGRKTAEKYGIIGPKKNKLSVETAWAKIFWAMMEAQND